MISSIDLFLRRDWGGALSAFVELVAGAAAAVLGPALVTLGAEAVVVEVEGMAEYVVAAAGEDAVTDAPRDANRPVAGLILAAGAADAAVVGAFPSAPKRPPAGAAVAGVLVDDEVVEDPI